MTEQQAHPAGWATPERIGEIVGLSEPRRISQNHINAFAKLTGDLQWVHVNPERAASGPYGATIVHGYLLLSLLPSFTKTVIDFASDGATVINYGLDRVRFIAPTRVDAVLVDRISLVSVRERGSAVQVGLSHELIETQSGQSVCVAETLTLIEPPK